jgi:hypothetical protein
MVKMFHRLHYPFQARGDLTNHLASAAPRQSG